LFLLFLDLASKHIFRVYEESLDLPFILIEGYLYVEQIFLHYGSVFSQAESPEDASFLGNAFFYLGCAIALVACSLSLISKDKEDSFWGSAPFVLMIPGVLGNSIDKLYYGGVVDWLTVTKPGIEFFNILNLADLYILLGLLGLIFVFVDTLKWRLFWLITWSVYVLVAFNMRILFY